MGIIMPRRCVRSLESPERAALACRFEMSADVRLAHRHHAGLLSADGCPMPKIAALLQVDQLTVHSSLDRFEAHGVEGLVIQ